MKHYKTAIVILTAQTGLEDFFNDSKLMSYLTCMSLPHITCLQLKLREKYMTKKKH